MPEKVTTSSLMILVPTRSLLVQDTTPSVVLGLTQSVPAMATTPSKAGHTSPPATAMIISPCPPAPIPSTSAQVTTPLMAPIPLKIKNSSSPPPVAMITSNSARLRATSELNRVMAMTTWKTSQPISLTTTGARGTHT